MCTVRSFPFRNPGNRHALEPALSHDTGGIFIKRLSLLLSLVCAVCQLGVTSHAFGHGFAGARFFPATLSTDDPFVSDELSLPTVSTIKTPEGRETSIASDIAKRITPNLGIDLGEEFLDLSPKGEHEVSGFGNLELGAK